MLQLFLFTLLIVIIVLGVLLLMPPKSEGYTFDSLISEMSEKQSKLRWVNITYLVNVSLNGSIIQGEAYYYKDDYGVNFTLSPTIKRFGGYAVMINPGLIINFINTSTRRDYSYYFRDNEWYCPSVITEPDNAYYTHYINGSYFFVTCFDVNSGYPAVMYNSEVSDDYVFYSKFFIKNITYH